MQMNCDSVNKLVKQLQTDRDALLARERRDSSFSYLVGESAIIPEYHFTVVQDQIDRYNQRIIARAEPDHRRGSDSHGDAEQREA